MPLLISVIDVPPTSPKARNTKTRVQVQWGKTAKGKAVPFLLLYPEDGPYRRYLTQLTVADKSSNLILQGAAQLVIAEKRIAGLMVNAELTNAATRQKMKLVQDTGRMACFSVDCESLGLVGVPSNRRGKPRAIHLGTDIDKADGFAIKVTDVLGFLNADGSAGLTTMERIASVLEECGLTVSRGVSIY
jgi:hypothetical protein